MWIEHIKMKNYRQYQDEKVVFDSPREGKNFTVIQGDNGSGKTNLINAVTWCLYGKEGHLTAKNKGLDIYNTLAPKDLKPGDKLEVCVEVQFRESDGGRIIISRSLDYELDDNKKVVLVPDYHSRSDDHSTLEMMRQIGKDMKEVKDPEFIIQKLIPEKIEEYFLFDGERLDEYFKEKSGVKIAEAVFKISQIELLERTIDHLKAMKQDFVRDRNDLSPRVEEIQGKIDALTKTFTELDNRLKKTVGQRDDAERLELEARGRISQAPVQNIGKLEDERSELETEIGKAKTELSEMKRERVEYLATSAPIVFTIPCIRQSIELIGQSEAAGRIPPEYEPGFVNKLLKNETCICGREITKGGPEYDKVRGLLTRASSIGGLTKRLVGNAGSLEVSLQKARDLAESVTKQNGRIQNLEKRIESMEKRKGTIDALISGCDSEMIRQYEAEAQEYHQKKMQLSEEVGKLKLMVKSTESRITEMEKERNKELRNQTKYQELVSLLDFCQDALTVAIAAKEKVMEDVRREIEEQTREHFLNMIWKEKTYSNVEIGEDYNVSVKHVSGCESIGTLSAGERQVLALSFVAALNNVSGFDAPLIIDTPLGRISSEPRTKIAKALPSCFPERQVILLMTDEEYTPTVRDSLKDHVSREYSIRFTEYEDGSDAKVIENA